MGYRNLQECVKDIEKTGQLIRIDTEINPHLEVGAIQRRVFRAKGPALFFTNIIGTPFPMLGNLFGTIERTHYLFRDTLEAVNKFINLKIDPSDFLKHPFHYRKVPRVALNLRPKNVRYGPVMECQTSISQLPQLISWPQDGGAFITLPQVYSESVLNPGCKNSNLGMYRIQISGGQYKKDQEIGLHYQIHRGIGVHQTEAIRSNKPLRVNIFVGGTPAMTLAAIMPLPEGLSELHFAGALSGHRIPMIQNPEGLPLYAEADFCITGTIIPNKLLTEGPFGDHLGYYSLQHDYPVLRVDHVYHRKNAIWPFTTVGRPPQEDTVFGEFIHELTRPIIPTIFPGIHAVHAVDATGVHPLLLVIGSERYTPYSETKGPQEILTQANSILGQGQLSLSKYVMMMNKADNPQLDLHDIPSFFKHILERVDWKRDLHFQTRTTIDTLDYSGTGLNEGSKVVIAAVGTVKKKLPIKIPADLNLPDGFSNPQIILPGILVLTGPKGTHAGHGDDPDLNRFCQSFNKANSINHFPLIVIVDDSHFTSQTLNNFLWTTFTRSNPSTDIYGIESFIKNKHWGCHGSLIIDARSKPHHAPALENDPQVEKRVNELGKSGGPLEGII